MVPARNTVDMLMCVFLLILNRRESGFERSKGELQICKRIVRTFVALLRHLRLNGHSSRACPPHPIQIFCHQVEIKGAPGVRKRSTQMQILETTESNRSPNP